MSEARHGRLPASMMRHHSAEAALALRLLSPNPDDRPGCLELLNLLEVLWSGGSREGSVSMAPLSLAHQPIAPCPPTVLIETASSSASERPAAVARRNHHLGHQYRPPDRNDQAPRSAEGHEPNDRDAAGQPSSECFYKGRLYTASQLLSILLERDQELAEIKRRIEESANPT